MPLDTEKIVLGQTLFVANNMIQRVIDDLGEVNGKHEWMCEVLSGRFQGERHELNEDHFADPFLDEIEEELLSPFPGGMVRLGTFGSSSGLQSLEVWENRSDMSAGVMLKLVSKMPEASEPESIWLRPDQISRLLELLA